MTLAGHEHNICCLKNFFVTIKLRPADRFIFLPFGEPVSFMNTGGAGANKHKIVVPLFGLYFELYLAEPYFALLSIF